MEIHTQKCRYRNCKRGCPSREPAEGYRAFLELRQLRRGLAAVLLINVSHSLMIKQTPSEAAPHYRSVIDLRRSGSDFKVCELGSHEDVEATPSSASM